MKIIARSQRPKAGSRFDNILCLTIDRLNSDALGAYGATWLDTPAFDALASESVLFDSFYATSLDLDSLLRAFWRGESPSRFAASAEPPDAESLFRVMKRRGFRTFLISDDERVTLSTSLDSDDCDDRFLVERVASDAPVESLNQTAFFKNFKELSAFLVDLNDAQRIDKPAPWFVWAHFSGWNDAWDFPMERREQFRDVVCDPKTDELIPEESDPKSYAATEPPYCPRAPRSRRGGRGRNPSDARVPRVDASYEINDASLPLARREKARLAALDETERRQSVLQAYSGGISVFDETLGGFLGLLEEHGILRNTFFALAGTRGLALGAPGGLGRPQKGDAPSPFYAEEIRVPLLLRLPDETGATVRLPQLCEPRDLFATLRDWPEFAPNLSTREFWRLENREISPLAGRWGDDSGESDGRPDDDAFRPLDPDKPGRNLLTLLADEEGVVRDSIQVVAKDSESSERALIVDGWLLKSAPPAAEDRADNPNATDVVELFALPDDRYCVNDVADRCAEIADRLKTALDAARSS